MLKSYSNHKLRPIAAVDLLINYNNTEIPAEFEIVDISQENVLSGATAEALALVKYLLIKKSVHLQRSQCFGLHVGTLIMLQC